MSDCFSDKCCCSCKWRLKVLDYDALPKDVKIGWACAAPAFIENSGIAYIGDFEHGVCEFHTPRNMKWVKITPESLPEQETWVEITDGQEVNKAYVTPQFEFVPHPDSNQCFVGITHYRCETNSQRSDACWYADELNDCSTADIKHDYQMMLEDFGPKDKDVKIYKAELQRRGVEVR